MDGAGIGFIRYKPGAAVAAEAEVAFVLANAYIKQFGNANMTDICASVAAYADRLRRAAR